MNTPVRRVRVPPPGIAPAPSRLALRAALVLALVLATALPVTASAQCTPIDFEDLPPDTVVSYMATHGVTFSVQGLPCGVSYARIAVPPAGCSSGSQALRVDNGSEPECAELHPQWLLMEFDEALPWVRFTLGPGVSDSAQDYLVRFGSDGAMHNLYVPDAGAGVFHTVFLVADDGLIERVEVKGVYAGLNLGGEEWIDDLSMGDTTPPTVGISSPAFGTCLCADEDVVFTGIVCDDDGMLMADRLEHRQINAGPGEPWTQLAGVNYSPVCTNGWLYGVSVADLSHGWHYFRVTGENICGLTGNDTVALFVDKSFGSLSLSSPAMDQSVCGELNIIGSATDNCFDHYTVEYAPLGSEEFTPVDAANPTYAVPKHSDCRLAVWDTRQVDDGWYVIKLMGFDGCDNDDDRMVNVHVDNSEPCGPCPGDVTGDGVVNVDDLVMVILRWGVCP